MPVCPKCGEDNPERAKFCLNCATPLVPAEPERREVRKTVTVVFTDVTGSTSLGERLDPESLRKVMTRYFEEMKAVLERHGGTVEKFIGDAVMAVFGIPTLHEDDALRAVRAAAEMRDALERLNEGLDRDHGVTLSVRTGVNTGEVVAGDPSAGQALVTGDAVNTAARLEQSAAPGDVLLGGSTLRLVRDAVKIQPVEPLSLKGKAEAVQAYRLLEVLPGAPAFARRLDSPMVGRDRELGLLRDAFGRAVAERACHLFTVLGSAGVGKSRLVGEFLQSVADWATVLRGRCLSYGDGITFWPVTEVVKQAAGIGEEDPAEAARAKLTALLSDEEGGALIAERVGQVVGLVADSAVPEETFWGIRKLLESLARRGPLVVVFDDVHWAEPTFLDLVEHVADWTRDAPILLACLSRPELLDLRPGWGGGKMNATSILLEPLTEAESEILVRNLLGQAEMSDETRDRITRAAEGNPLFVEEMLAMLVDDGLLRWEEGRWLPAGDLSSVSVPPTIQALLAARLDRLSFEERQVIERASVVGKEFYAGALIDLAPEPLRPAVRTHLMSLVRKELIRPEPSAFGGEDTFRFRHLLLRDAAYESMPKRVRADLHEGFAAWLERATGERILEYEEILGWHLEQAYRYRGELGPLDEPARELARQAAERLAAAGRRAAARGDVGAASKLLRRAADLLPDGSAQRIQFLPDLASALAETGDFSRAQAFLEEAVKAAAAAGERGLEARGRLEAAMIRMHTDPTVPQQAAAEEAERAIGVFSELGDEGGLARAWLTIGWIRFWQGHSASGEQAWERAIEHALRAGDGRVIERSLQGFSTALMFGPTPGSEGIRRAEELRPLATSRLAELVILATQAVLRAMRGEFDEARSAMTSVEAALEELGLAVMLAAAHPPAVVELLADNPASVEERLRPGIEFLQRKGETGFLSTTAGYLAEALYLQGRLDEAERFAGLARETAAPDDVTSQVDWRRVRAKVLARRGETEGAESLAREAVELAAGTDYIVQHGDALMDLAEVLRLAGRSADAIPAVRQAIELYERKENAVSAGKARVVMAELSKGPAS